MKTRHQRAIEVARTIERIDHCPILSEVSLQSIEVALSEYTIDRVLVLRQQVVSETMDARGKDRVLALIDALLRGEAV